MSPVTMAMLMQTFFMPLFEFSSQSLLCFIIDTYEDVKQDMNKLF